MQVTGLLKNWWPIKIHACLVGSETNTPVSAFSVVSLETRSEEGKRFNQLNSASGPRKPAKLENIKEEFNQLCHMQTCRYTHTQWVNTFSMPADRVRKKSACDPVFFIFYCDHSFLFLKLTMF